MFVEMPELMKVVRESLEFVCQGPVTMSWVDRNIREIEANYNDRTPSYSIQYESAKEKAGLFFNDANKTELWFESENPHFGNVKPIEMIVIGKVDKLLSFIENQLEGNNP